MNLARLAPRLAPLLALVSVACGPGDTSDEGGAKVTITVAPLELTGVTDAAFNLRTFNAEGDLVWERLDLTSSRFGDGSGSLSYVGPCDASSNPNRVELEVADLVGPLPGTWVNPAPPGQPVSLTTTCVENADRPVNFNITIARDAEQGFFDVGVNFQTVFCSAKLDCLNDSDQPLHFLHDPETGERAQTAILALACTAGPDLPTEIYRSDVTITCGNGSTYTFSPTAGIGNTGGQAPGVFQSAIYAGREAFPGVNKCYWNMALGLDLVGLGPDCVLTATATASPEPLVGGAIPSGHVWPVIRWQAPLTDDSGLLACGRSPLNGSDGVVATTYSSPEGMTFSRLLDCQTERFDNPGAIACNGQVQVDGDGLDVEVLTADGAITLRAGSASSAALALPAGMTASGCCADPCCQ